MSRRPASLHARVLALVLAVVGIAWLGAALAGAAAVRHELDELLDGHLAQAAALLIAQQSLGDDGDVHDEPPLPLPSSPRVVYQVWHEGRLMLRSPNAPLSPMARHTSGFSSYDAGGDRWRVFGARGVESDIQVYVGESMATREEIVAGLMKGLFLPLAVAMPLLAVAAGWVVRRGLAPLRSLALTLTRRPPDATAPLALADPPAELRAVSAALDALFGRIGALLDGERRFTADAAHELRTPIAAIAAQAQVALAATDDATRRHALANTIAGCERAARLVDQMLTLARLDHDAPAPAQPVDLPALARGVVAALLPAAQARGQTVEIDAPVHAVVSGDEALLGVLLRNLVDNALRHSPPGARVALAITAGGDGWRVDVDDSGPGLPAAERGRLGERFFRVPGTDASGSGLGWSIVRRIAAVLRLAVEAAPSPALGGLRVSVSAGA